MLWGLSAHPDLVAMIEGELKLRAAGQNPLGALPGPDPAAGPSRPGPSGRGAAAGRRCDHGAQRSTSTSSTQALTAAMAMARTNETGSQ